MSDQSSDIALAMSRPLEESDRPQRRTLHLEDGYETGVYVYGRQCAEGREPVLYAHGIQSHPGWFAGSCAYLARAGHQVFAVCRRGSGDNARHRGHASSAGQLLGDVESACRYVLETTGRSRLGLVGVSWGGKLLASYAASPLRCVDIASLVLIAPGIVPQVDVGLAEKLTIALALLVAPQRRFDIPLSGVRLFTDNPVMQDYLRRDRYALHRATARFLYADRQLDGLLRRAGRGAIAAPTTLILARRDRIVNSAATRRVVETLTAGQAAVVELDGAHTLEFEADPQPLYEAILAGLGGGGGDAQAPPGPG